jgi:transposase
MYYMTVVLDLGSGALLHAQEGKDAQALIGFLERLKRSHAPLEAVAIDMSEAYLSAVRQVFGDRLDVVHDPYPVVALANQAIDQTHRGLVHTLQREDAQVLKGGPFLLLRGFEHLTDDAREGLGALRKLNRPLYEVYVLKEQLWLFWRLPNVATAEAFLDH